MTSTSRCGFVDAGLVISSSLFAFSVLSLRLISYKKIIREEFELDEIFIKEFIRCGIVVIPNVLNANEIKESRKKFHSALHDIGVDTGNLFSTAGALSKLSSTGGAGGILDIFYANWKLALNEHPVIVAAYTKLIEATYAAPSPSPLWTHPFGSFHADNIFMYIDRCCFRVS